MAEVDLIIRNGTVIDGTGGPVCVADLAVHDGFIVGVGTISGTATRVVDAAGATVAPGFVDIHTHYDGQATWDERLTPSSWHGVTTVVMGNCGVGFAPVRRRDHSRLIELMEGVEDIPGAALHEGLSWQWESFAEYLDALESRPHDIDLAAQVPHGALRLYVMGDRGARREPASDDEIELMGRLAAEAVTAGALGFTTSRTLNHRTSTGEPTPTLTAARAELVGIARAIGATGRGVLQVVSDFLDFDDEIGTLRAMAEVSGRPVSISIAQHPRAPLHYRRLLASIAEANADGFTMRAQVAARGIGVLVGLAGTVNPWRRCPTYRRFAAERNESLLASLMTPQVRTKILAEYPGHRDPLLVDFQRVFVLGDQPDYEPDPESSVGARAAREGRSAEEVMYDLLLADQGRALLYLPVLNYADGNLDAVAEMLADPYAVPGLSDGGAHVGTICDGSFPTTLLAHWGRDRHRGPLFDLAWLISRQSRATAEAVGLLDRGIIAPGMRADLNVIDLDRLGLDPPRMAYDLPAGGKRLLQRAHGYRHTFVAGVEVYHDGEPTGALPGRLVRGPQEPR